MADLGLITLLVPLLFSYKAAIKGLFVNQHLALVDLVGTFFQYY